MAMDDVYKCESKECGALITYGEMVGACCPCGAKARRVDDCSKDQYRELLMLRGYKAEAKRLKEEIVATTKAADASVEERDRAVGALSAATADARRLATDLHHYALAFDKSRRAMECLHRVIRLKKKAARAKRQAKKARDRLRAHIADLTKSVDSLSSQLAQAQQEIERLKAAVKDGESKNELLRGICMVPPPQKLVADLAKRDGEIERLSRALEFAEERAKVALEKHDELRKGYDAMRHAQSVASFNASDANALIDKIKRIIDERI